MRALLLLVVALPLQGCAIAMGPAFPSHERGRSVVDTRVCLETAEGCGQVRESTKSTPVRSYSALVLPMMYMGGGSTRVGDTTFGNTTLNLAAEYMRGRGPWALGVRSDFVAVVQPGEGRGRPMVLEGSLMPVVHHGINDMFSAYAGLGPGIASSVDVGDPSRAIWTGRALAGLQMGFVTYRGASVARSHFAFNVEGSASTSLADRQYESWNLTGGILTTLD